MTYRPPKETKNQTGKTTKAPLKKNNEVVKEKLVIIGKTLYNIVYLR